MKAKVLDFESRRRATQALAAARKQHWGTEARITRDPGGYYWLANVVDGVGDKTIISATLDAVTEFENLRRAQALGATVGHSIDPWSGCIARGVAYADGWDDPEE